MRFFKFFAILIVLFFSINKSWSSSCIAMIDTAALKASTFGLTIGDNVNLMLDDSYVTDAKFLGQIIDYDGTPEDFAFYDHTTSSVHIFPADNTLFSDSIGSDVVEVDLVRPETVAKTERQVGGTCAAYAIYNCQRQMLYQGHEGNGRNTEELATEESRAEALRLSIHNYYDDGWHLDGIDQMTGRLGYHNVEIPNSNPQEFRRLVIEEAISHAVLIRFDVPPRMGRTFHSTFDHELGENLDRRIWIPRGEGEEKKGGHMILISGAFRGPAGNTYLLVQDSNWHTIRLWDSRILTTRMFSAHLRAWSVRP